MWGEQKARSYLAEAGFDVVAAHRLPHDFMNVYFVTGKPASGAAA